MNNNFTKAFSLTLKGVLVCLITPTLCGTGGTFRHYVERVVPLEGQGSELVEGGYRLWFSFLKVPWFIIGDKTRGRGNI